MKHVRQRIGLAAAISAVMTMVAVGQGPAASADDPPATPELEIVIGDSIVAPGTEGQSTWLYGRAKGADQLELQDGVLTIDASGLAGIATVTKPNSEFECESEGAVTRCRWSYSLSAEWSGYPPLQIAPLPGAEIGQKGTYTLTLSAANAKPSTVTAKVSVAQGVNLTAVKKEQKFTRTVGEALPVQLRVRNTGTAPVRGVTLEGYFDAAFQHTLKYSNCLYFNRQWFRCHFDTTLAVGAQYKLRQALPLRVAHDTWAPSKPYAEYLWRTPADLKHSDTGLPLPEGTQGIPGTDGKLSLVQETVASLAGEQTDTQPEDNWGSIAVKVTGDQTANFRAIGSTVYGAVGDVVDAMAGVWSDGPARRDWGRWGEPAQSLRVEIPAGATVLAAPKDCYAWDGDIPGEPGARTYLCRSAQYHHDLYETLTFNFRLRVDSVAPSLGSVTVNLQPGDFDKRMVDINPSDDVSLFRLNPVG